MKKLAILGSTGSIGKSALSLVDLYPDRFQVETLATGSSAEELCGQAQKYRPSLVAVHDLEAAEVLRRKLPETRVTAGLEGVTEAACHLDVDAVVAAISGAAGLVPTYEAVLAGKEIALANKETLVMAGDLIMRAAQARGVRIMPVDSEHSALHQCLDGSDPRRVRRLLLTASGGPLFGKSKDEIERVTVEEALRHPTWEMGPKITIDSATLMNKGLEVIEAHHLFGMPGEKIDIVIHPQSIVHSMVEFVDGNVLAQMSITDMRSVILYALSYPEKWKSELPRLDLFSIAPLEFHPPDTDRFPCIRLAYEALEKGETFPAALNAANEAAVEAFLQRRIPFSRIPQVIEEVLGGHDAVPADTLDAVLGADREARRQAREMIEAIQTAPR